MTVKITLTKPIEAHGQKVSELELREPNGGDIAECGLPFEMAVGTNGQSTGKVDGAAVLRYIRAREHSAIIREDAGTTRFHDRAGRSPWFFRGIEPRDAIDGITNSPDSSMM